jgi:enoyl-CoA hydratase/carnithine racemase
MHLTQTRYEINDHIAVVTLSRPEKMNAFNPVMRDELLEIFSAADQDDDIRVVVVTGAGKAFCAGADLSGGRKAFDRTTEEGKPVPVNRYRDNGGRVALAIYQCRKPVIAAINGPAVGVGITITLPMDLRIAAEEAKIGFPFTRRGVVPEGCSSWFLPRIVGIAKAIEWIYSSRIFPAASEAHSGLFNYVVPHSEVLPKSMSLAKEIAENTSAVSITLSKAMLWHGLSEVEPQSSHLIESRCFYWAGQQKDAQEGAISFLEKRPAQFTMKVSTELPDFYPWWKEPKV